MLDNMSSFNFNCSLFCQCGILAGKLEIYTIDGSMYFAKNKCNTIIIAPRRQQHPSSCANRPSDGGVTVNFNAECNLMPVNPIIQYFSRDLLAEYCQGIEARAISTVPPLSVEYLHGR
jgi:hypothetical protein